MKAGQLQPDDLVWTFISRRVLPLQRRMHKICQMSGRWDPTRTTTFLMHKADVVAKVRSISTSLMSEDWEWGMEPYQRSNMAPFISFDTILCFYLLPILSIPVDRHVPYS